MQPETCIWLFSLFPLGPHQQRFQSTYFLFFWLESLVQPTDKVTRSHQEKEFQSSKQTCSALQTPYKRLRSWSSFIPTKPKSCHPISTPSVCINQTAQHRFSFHFSRSVMMDDVQWHFWIHNNGNRWCLLTPTRLNFMGPLGYLPWECWAKVLCSWKDYCSLIIKDNLITWERVKHQAIWFQNPEIEYQRIINYENQKSLILMS